MREKEQERLRQLEEAFEPKVGIGCFLADINLNLAKQQSIKQVFYKDILPFATIFFFLMRYLVLLNFINFCRGYDSLLATLIYQHSFKLYLETFLGGVCILLLGFCCNTKAKFSTC